VYIQETSYLYLFCVSKKLNSSFNFVILKFDRQDSILWQTDREHSIYANTRKKINLNIYKQKYNQNNFVGCSR